MVEVRVHPERVVAGEHRAEFIRDPVGEDNRNLGAEPDHLDVLDVVEFGQDPVEAVVGEHERVAPGEEDVPDTGDLPDVVEALDDLGLRGDGVDVPDLPLPGAVPAVHGADVADQEEHPVGVAMGDTETEWSASSASRSSMSPGSTCSSAGDGKHCIKIGSFQRSSGSMSER